MASVANTHWYASPRTVELYGDKVQLGESIDLIQDRKTGQWREIKNWDDVRWVGAAPGCTSVCGTLAKTGLSIWAENLICDGSYELAKELGGVGDYDQQGWKVYLKQKKDEVGKQAAAAGSVIHDRIESAIKTDRLFIDDDPYVRSAARVVDQIITNQRGEGFRLVEMAAERSFCIEDVITFGGRTDLLLVFTNEEANEVCYMVLDWKTRNFTFADAQKATDGYRKGNKTFGKLSPRETEPMQIAANLVGHIGGTEGMTNGGKTIRIGGGNLYLSRNAGQEEAAFYYPYSNEELALGWDSFRACQTLYLATVLGGDPQKRAGESNE